MDINTKKLTKNAYRVTKERYKTALRVRVPGGRIEAKYLIVLQQIADTYGIGDLHLTTRQGFKNPRLAEDFLIWADEESILKIILNTYDYVEEYIDRSLPKEHIGYIVDRMKPEKFSGFFVST